MSRSSASADRPRKAWAGRALVAVVVAALPAAFISAELTSQHHTGLRASTEWLATDDGYVSHGEASATAIPYPLSIAVGSDGANGAEHIGYVKFDVDRPATDAHLVLTVLGGAPGVLQLHGVTTGWDETDLIAESAPTPGVVLASVPLSGGAQTIHIDLGSHIGLPTEYAFALTRPGSAGVTYVASRERGDASAPRLLPSKPEARATTSGHQQTGSGAPTSPTTEPSDAPTATPSPSHSRTPSLGWCPGVRISEKLVPSCGTWFGVGAVPVAGESWDQAILDFEKVIERQVDIVHYYRRGRDKVFPTANELERVSDPDGDRLLFYNWRPVELTWRQIADGAADKFLAKLARHMVEVHPEPFFLSLNAEMERYVDPTKGSGQTAADFRDFFRHTIKVLRANGATQVVTVVNYMGAPHWGEEPWFETLYPGDDVVDWIAQDPYSFGKPPVFLTDFAGMVNRRFESSESTWPGFYTWATRNYPDKPMMLAEWGVEEVPDDPSYKPGFFRTAIAQLKAFPAIKALVYWNAPDSRLAGVTRVDSSEASQEAVQEFVQHPMVKLPGDEFLREALEKRDALLKQHDVLLEDASDAVSSARPSPPH